MTSYKEVQEPTADIIKGQKFSSYFDQKEEAKDMSDRSLFCQ